MDRWLSFRGVTTIANEQKSKINTQFERLSGILLYIKGGERRKVNDYVVESSFTCTKQKRRNAVYIEFFLLIES